MEGKEMIEKMEGKEMIEIYSDIPVMRDLIQLREDSRLTSIMKDRIQSLEQGMQLLVLYRFLSTHETSTFDEVNRINAVLGNDPRLSRICVLALDSKEYEEWETLSSELLEEIWSYKPSIREACIKFANYMFSDCLCTDQLRKLMMYAIVSMANVLHLKVHMIPDEKVKFESLKEKLNSFVKVFEFTRKYWNTGDCEIEVLFNISITTWGWNAACFYLLHWALDEDEENEEPQLNLAFSKLQQNFDRVLPDVTRMCLSCLKATRPSAEDRFKAGELVLRFFELLLENLKGFLAEDHFEMLLNGMVLSITFLMDPPPPEAYHGQGIFIQVDDAFADATSIIISMVSGRMNKVDIAEAKNLGFKVFLEKVDTIREEVRKTYPQLLLDLSSINGPRINILRLFDTILENLKEISLNSPNHPIMAIHQGLVLLRDVVKSLNLKGLRRERKGQKDLWTKICNVAHQADRTIKSFTYLKGFLWVDLFCLFYVKEEIKCVLIEGIQDQHMNDTDACKTEMNLSPVVPLQTNVQTMDEGIVGFEDRAKDIRDWLTNGSEKLNIMSIIGMPGLGKTTLARKVYNDPSIKRHFTKSAWCTVSQSYDNRKLLLDILNDVAIVNDSFFKMDEAELALKLKQCLHGQKYLIVMDDIWDVGAWNAVKLSFPDDDKNCRILLTSRIHDVALRVKPDSSTYVLTPLTNEDSWELLEKRLFHGKDICPRDFVKVGKQIAIDCDGLPLAVVLVAGLLKKNVENLNWWKQIGENIDSRIAEQGCAHILELSYKHLPEHLKACFLYFGLFPEDKVITMQKLTKLWVSEGFIQKHENKDAEIVAKEYAMDLVCRSLLIVTTRSSTGGIKACRIHDLLREFCLAKSEDEHFLRLLQGNDVSELFKDALDNHYRVCIQAQHWSSLFVWSSFPFHSLLIYLTGTLKKFGTGTSFFSARFLQVLDLENVECLGDFPEGVTTLILLRYLAIWCFIKSIPPTIVNLENLETLRIRTDNICAFPPRILKMEKLRHVDIGKFVTIGWFLKSPSMKNIQSLSFPCLTYGREAEMFLAKMPTIRKLRCQFGLYQRDGHITKLDFLNHLESLNVSHEGRRSLPGFDFSLPSALKKLTLSNFYLPCTELSKISKLPNLEVLKLQNHAFEGKCWNAENDEFLKLKFLKLQKSYIGKWTAYNENFPSLEQIVLEECWNLEEIPNNFGDIASLRMIQIRWCHSSVVDSAREIQEQQVELGNENFKILTMEILKQ